MGSRLGLVFAHQGAAEAALFADAVRACREAMPLYVVGVLAREDVRPLGIEDEAIPIREWHSVAAAWDCGILHALHAGVEAILVANDDTVFSPAALLRLRSHLDGGYACVCPCAPEIPVLYPWLADRFPPDAGEAYRAAQDARRQGEDLDAVFACWYAGWGGFEAFSAWMAERNAGQFAEPYFHGLAFMGGAGLFEEVGLFDLRFRPGYHEDVDYARRITALGIRSCMAYDAYFHHWGGATASRQGDWSEAWARNEARLAEKERRGYYSLQP